MARLPWKPWHEIVALRDDLKSGELSLHMFAADLYEVLMKNGKRPIYEEPTNFFSLTFPTYNLRELVREVVLRVAGENDKAVRQLELTYGGGKTHTLITLLHMVTAPDKLPDLPAVNEFIQAIGQAPPRARVAGLCFDKLDVEKGMEVFSPNGKRRMLRQPWSVLAYQLAGDEGLKILHADDKPEERESAPAENLLTELLETPVKEDLGVLILIDEVLMYAREKVTSDVNWKARLMNFFQYLTQAATKVDRCCIVASLLASDPAKSDQVGRQLQNELYNTFQRQREEAVEPVAKEDVAEVLRRRFFTPESIKTRDSFRPHVQAALKGLYDLDEQVTKGTESEERYLRSYPFHPDLTEVLYTKWTSLNRFQRTRGVLRTFALALREAQEWDNSPLVGSAVFLSAPDKNGLSEALQELVTIADTEEHEGRRHSWTGIIEGEIRRARDIQNDSVGLEYREIEQAVISTFLHSQPIGQNAHTRDLITLVGPYRTDKIELEKGLMNWAQVSYWLDDKYTAISNNKLPDTWRLGSRPNLTQMHSVAAAQIPDEQIQSELQKHIGKEKSLTNGASAAGVTVHILPAKPSDIGDDGCFHYAVLGINATSDSGSPSSEAKRYLDEKTGPNSPRVYRNALILLTPSSSGITSVITAVRDYMAWDKVRFDLKQLENENLDVARMQTLTTNLDISKGRISETIRQAYSIVVTISESNKVHAFKINITDQPHFEIIKNDTRSRIQDTSISPEALLPDGPYNLWRERETARLVKDLSSSFAQLPHLPKMLKAQAVLDTLVEGCLQGAFVLRLSRPDGSYRTWWYEQPDDDAMADSELELVLPNAAEIQEINFNLILPNKLPELWQENTVTVEDLINYFNGKNVVQIQKNGYSDQIHIPYATEKVIHAAVKQAVEQGLLWLTNAPASILAEPIPVGILNAKAKLQMPPADILATEIMPESLPNAWSNENGATALSIATALCQHSEQALPWKTITDVITASLRARFISVDATSGEWPCDYPKAEKIKLKVEEGSGAIPYDSTLGGSDKTEKASKILTAQMELEPREIQDFGDIVSELLKIKNEFGTPIVFSVQVEFGDGEKIPDTEAMIKINTLLNDIREGFELK